MIINNSTHFASQQSECSNNKKLQANVIKQAIDPQAFYAHGLNKISRKTKAWVDGGLCPFHADNKPGSFKVNLATGAFKCFACDSVGGDIIAFTMTLYGLPFREALTKLATEWGISSC